MYSPNEDLLGYDVVYVSLNVIRRLYESIKNPIKNSLKKTIQQNAMYKISLESLYCVLYYHIIGFPRIYPMPGSRSGVKKDHLMV